MSTEPIVLGHAEKHAGAAVIAECTREAGYLPIEVVEGVIAAINNHRERQCEHDSQIVDDGFGVHWRCLKCGQHTCVEPCKITGQRNEE